LAVGRTSNIPPKWWRKPTLSALQLARTKNRLMGKLNWHQITCG
jgi:hypothetical protein